MAAFPPKKKKRVQFEDDIYGDSMSFNSDNTPSDIGDVMSLHSDDSLSWMSFNSDDDLSDIGDTMSFRKLDIQDMALCAGVFMYAHT